MISRKIFIKILLRRNCSFFPCYLLARENIREKLAMHIRLWAGMSVNTGKMRKYTSNFEFYALFTASLEEMNLCGRNKHV